MFPQKNLARKGLRMISYDPIKLQNHWVIDSIANGIINKRHFFKIFSDIYLYWLH